MIIGARLSFSQFTVVRGGVLILFRLIVSRSGFGISVNLIRLDLVISVNFIISDCI